MGKAGAYLEYGRHYHGERPTEEAIHDFDAVSYTHLTLPTKA